MMDELVAKFLPRFVTLATSRIERSIVLVTARERGAMEQVAHDMHGLAGEAGLLGLERITQLARGLEAHARTLGGSPEGADPAALLAELRALGAAVSEVTRPPT